MSEELDYSGQFFFSYPTRPLDDDRIYFTTSPVKRRKRRWKRIDNTKLSEGEREREATRDKFQCSFSLLFTHLCKSKALHFQTIDRWRGSHEK